MCRETWCCGQICAGSSWNTSASVGRGSSDKYGNFSGSFCCLKCILKCFVVFKSNLTLFLGTVSCGWVIAKQSVECIFSVDGLSMGLGI